MNISQINTPTFQARCPQIRDGQKVVSLINQNFPHVSDTRLRTAFYNAMEKDIPQYKKTPIVCLFRRFADKMNETREDYLGIFNNCFVGAIRPLKIFQMFKLEHLGNCFENAKAAETILKMNGIENACCASLQKGTKSIDHMVCVFNRDGSYFDGKIINNQTIIVDPWLNKVDFANNMFKIYENICQKLLKIPSENKFSFRNISRTRIPENDMNLLKSFFPNLVFKK